MECRYKSLLNLTQRRDGATINMLKVVAIVAAWREALPFSGKFYRLPKSTRIYY